MLGLQFSHVSLSMELASEQPVRPQRRVSQSQSDPRDLAICQLRQWLLHNRRLVLKRVFELQITSRD